MCDKLFFLKAGASLDPLAHVPETHSMFFKRNKVFLKINTGDLKIISLESRKKKDMNKNLDSQRKKNVSKYEKWLMVS